MTFIILNTTIVEFRDKLCFSMYSMCRALCLRFGLIIDSHLQGKYLFNKIIYKKTRCKNKTNAAFKVKQEFFLINYQFTD